MFRLLPGAVQQGYMPLPTRAAKGGVVPRLYVTFSP